jgi:hypothetical protein
MGVLDTWFRLTYPRTNTDKKMSEDLVTHFCMKGGKFHVPCILADEFLDKFVEAICNGERLYLIERRTPVFPMFFDFDVVQVGEMKDMELSEIISILGRVFSNVYPHLSEGDMYSYIFKASKPESPDSFRESNLQVEDSEGTTQSCFKTGFHIIYPQILVNQQNALTIRKIFIAELKNELGERVAPKNTWEDLVDECVFLSNGLRMVFSNKTARCHVCKGKSKSNSGVSCMTCSNNGRIDVGRPYVPHAVFSSSGNMVVDELTRIQTDHEYCLRKASIRRDNPSFSVTSFILPEGHTHAPEPESRSYKRRVKEMKNGVRDLRYDGSQYETDASQSGSWRKSMIQMPPEDPLFNRLKDFVNRLSVYEKTAIHSIFHNKTRKAFFVKTTGHNSTFCMNKGDCHNSNSIYFYIGKNQGCSQRCFKRECKEWKSKPVPLPSELEQDLFNEKTVQAVVHEEKESMTNRDILFPMTSKSAKQRKLKLLRLQGIQNECNLSELKKSMEVSEKSRVQYNNHPSLPNTTKEQLYTWGMKDYMKANAARNSSKGDKLTEIQEVQQSKLLKLKSKEPSYSSKRVNKKRALKGMSNKNERKRKNAKNSGTIATF